MAPGDGVGRAPSHGRQEGCQLRHRGRSLLRWTLAKTTHCSLKGMAAHQCADPAAAGGSGGRRGRRCGGARGSSPCPCCPCCLRCLCCPRRWLCLGSSCTACARRNAVGEEHRFPPTLYEASVTRW